jgi:hypothetical protein
MLEPGIASQVASIVPRLFLSLLQSGCGEDKPFILGN